MNKVCVLIPFFNHGDRLVSLIDTIEHFSIPIIVVNDGSTENDSISALQKIRTRADVMDLEVNSGKGAALIAGFRHAGLMGFTHAVCVDADGQHDSEDIPKLLSQLEPEMLILGKPVFGADVPLERLWGRKISTVFAWLQTQSTAIKDILCGFRVYPLRQILPLLDQVKSRRMGFDIEIVIRYFWKFGTIRTFDTKVIYPEHGRSHFRYLSDNLSLFALHLQLLIEGIWLGARKNLHWSERAELGSKKGLRFMLFMLQILGRAKTKALLIPIVFFYLIFAKTGRNALFRLHRRLAENAAVTQDRWVFAYRSFMYFALSMVDSVLAWKGSLSASSVCWKNDQQVYSLLARKQSAVILTAHFGPVEAVRAMQKHVEGLKIYTLMYLKNAQNFRDFLHSVNPKANDDVICVDRISTAELVSLSDRIKDGKFLGIMGDRVLSDSRIIKRKFLGKTAAFPEGPFTMAAIMQLPILVMLANYTESGQKIEVNWFRLELPSDLPRADRVNLMVEQYVDLLERHLKKHPEQFFNYYDFWSADC